MTNEDYLLIELRHNHPRCPFYGFNGMYGAFHDSGGNQCGLIIDSFAPCKMEFNGDEFDFTKCSLNTEKIKRFISDYGDKVRVHPKECNRGNGVSLLKWISLVMLK